MCCARHLACRPLGACALSLTDSVSYDGVKDFYQQLMQMHEDDVPPIVICGEGCRLGWLC